MLKPAVERHEHKLLRLACGLNPAPERQLLEVLGLNCVSCIAHDILVDNDSLWSCCNSYPGLRRSQSTSVPSWALSTNSTCYMTKKPKKTAKFRIWGVGKIPSFYR